MILELNQTLKSLGRSEAKALFGKITKEYENYVEVNDKKINQAGLIRKAYKEIKNYKIKGTFKIINSTKENIEKHTYNFKQQGNKVSITNPDNKIVIKNEKVLKLIWENKEDFKSRKSHLRIKNKPLGINPKIARAMINIANEENITDPFCGTGGIILEGLIVNKKMTGIDIDPEMINITKKEIEKINKEDKTILKVANSTNIKIKTNAIVTDIPYGKNSKTTNTQEHIINELLKNTTAKKAIICKKKSDKQLKIPKNWKITGKHELYVHKSMTREILELVNTRINTL
ncbi:MAG: TRM11 family SAM-dependent methyltransferase [Candidatus Woesearchaeota archaeon]